MNRISPKGKEYFRCRVCRNDSERNRINKTKYLITPKKHEKHKLPSSIIKKEDKTHAYTIRWKFKLTALEYYEMLKKQNFVCLICKKPETNKNKRSLSNKTNMLSIDHCHESAKIGIMKIRGLLCHHCNSALGHFKDSIENLEEAIKYLKASK